MNKVIEVSGFKKEFAVLKSQNGRFKKVIRYLFPEYEAVTAVEDVTFSINEGERVAFIGPNGAGKSTTIKALTGIFSATAGTISVLGKDPFKERIAVAREIGTVFGQRSQLWMHLPAIKSFKILATIYDLDHDSFQQELEMLVNQFQITPFLHRCVKELSLGQRMRCELVASLLHKPKILFLDEPTIGLDVISKTVIRKLILERSEKFKTTIFLTSHDTADIEKVCDRVIILNRGHLIMDSPVNALNRRLESRKRMSVQVLNPFSNYLLNGVTLIEKRELHYTFEIDQKKTTVQKFMQHLSRQSEIIDLCIHPPPLEEVIKEIYNA